jgi:Na+-transporting methylmalonyl-CoA/oxaloacetate decarboxylase gamma subunit
MIEEGLRLMAIGMSGVFGFLGLLVVLMHASGRVWGVLAEWFPEPVVSRGAPSGIGTAAVGIDAGPSARDEEAIAVVIAIAAATRTPTPTPTPIPNPREERST